MELKEALDIMLNSKIENEQLNDEQEEAYATVLAAGNLDSYLTTDEEQIKFSNSHVMYLMYCKKTLINKKFSEEYGKRITMNVGHMSLLPYDSFCKTMDEILDSDEDFTLKVVKNLVDDVVLCDFVSDELRERIRTNKLPEDKDLYYKIIYIISSAPFVEKKAFKDFLDSLMNITNDEGE